MASPRWRTRPAETSDQSRPRGAGGLLRRLCALGRGHGSHPEIWPHDQIAEWIPRSVTLSGHRQPAGGDYDAPRLPLRLYARPPPPNLNAVERGALFV